MGMHSRADGRLDGVAPDLLLNAALAQAAKAARAARAAKAARAARAINSFRHRCKSLRRNFHLLSHCPIINRVAARQWRPVPPTST